MADPLPREEAKKQRAQLLQEFETAESNLFDAKERHDAAESDERSARQALTRARERFEKAKQALTTTIDSPKGGRGFPA